MQNQNIKTGLCQKIKTAKRFLFKLVFENEKLMKLIDKISIC